MGSIKMKTGAGIAGKETKAPADRIVAKGMGKNENPAAHLYVLFGSRTGNSKAAAELAHGYSRHLGIESSLVDISVLNHEQFASFRNILFAVSTHGEGDPPAVAEDFYNFIHSDQAPAMEGVRFSVLALGDSSYRDFCKTGKDIAGRFRELGAEEALPLIECDIDYEENAKKWVRDSIELFGKLIPRKGNGSGKPFAFEINKRESDYENAYFAPVVEKRLLTGNRYEKKTMHLELSIKDFAGGFEPGDSFGVYMNNSRLLVDALLREMGFDGTRAVDSVKGRKLLKEALLSDYEITVLTPVVINRYASASGNKSLGNMLKETDSLSAYCKTRDILDMVRDYPSDISPEEFLGVLRNLSPRTYSVANSPLQHPGQLHFTVGLIDYNLEERRHRGVCSVYLEDRVEIGDSIPVIHEPNEKFRLPGDDSAPVIMIATGTGIAPYRAFLQHRSVQGATGENWLVFGDRHRDSDFLYRDELMEFMRRGVLSRLDTAFSRDGAEKIYVQDVLDSQGADFYDWIENRGAVVYLCGNKRTIGIDVRSRIEKIVAREGGLTRVEASDYIEKLKRDRRIMTDLY